MNTDEIKKIQENFAQKKLAEMVSKEIYQDFFKKHQYKNIELGIYFKLFGFKTSDIKPPFKLQRYQRIEKINHD